MAAPSSRPPPRCSFGENEMKITRRIYISRRFAGLGPSRVRTRIPSTRRLGQSVSLRKILRFRVRQHFPSLVACLFSWRCLAACTSYFLHAAMNLCPPSATVSIHTSAFSAVAFQSSTMPNARMSLCTQSLHSLSFPPRPLRTAPSRFPKAIRFGNQPPLVRMSVPAYKSLLVCKVVSMLSHRVTSRTRLNEVIRWSGLLRCVPIMRSKTQWCTVRSLA